MLGHTSTGEPITGWLELDDEGTYSLPFHIDSVTLIDDEIRYVEEREKLNATLEDIAPNPGLRAEVRSCVDAIAQDGPSKAIADRIKSVLDARGLCKRCHEGTDPGDLTDNMVVEWYAGQLFAALDHKEPLSPIIWQSIINYADEVL
jgi:hypothetical protein